MHIARTQSAMELNPDMYMQFISLASHTSLALRMYLLHIYHVALAPQVEFELLEGIQQQKDKTSGSLYCIVQLQAHSQDF